MSRQVVSYDDLDALPSTSPQASPVKPISSPSTMAAAAATTRHHPTSVSSKIAAPYASSSPPAKKRRRDESIAGTNAFGDVGDDAILRVGGDAVPASVQNPSSFLPSAPKPPVKKNRRRSRRSGAGDGDRAEVSGSTSGRAAKGGGNGSTGVSMQHWDDPGVQTEGILYDESIADENDCTVKTDGLTEERDWEGGGEGEGDMGVEDEDEDEDESRELTHDEIWDDSALIAAWDAANEEYEGMHGRNKRWKKDRVHKSPLWYNIPPDKPPAKNKAKGKGIENSFSTAAPSKQQTHAQTLLGAVESSAPLDFNTYIPTHDASLSSVIPSKPPPVPEGTQAMLSDVTAYYETMLPASVNSLAEEVGAVSADDAFTRAIGAMYWSGYWTAVYHLQRKNEQEAPVKNDAMNDEDEVQGQEEEEEETELLVSTQR
ncbi:hypothetical protein DFH11DRAFT_1539791 [Phellopilus nigrolimitatus]|nr:hypothetical protein DFH11DRAFT_1539791 [Phellopilus nigrolimitatus]